MSNPTGVRARRLHLGRLRRQARQAWQWRRMVPGSSPQAGWRGTQGTSGICFYVQPAADSAAAHLSNHKLCPLEDRQAVERLRLPDGISEVLIVFDSTTDTTQIFRFGHALTMCLIPPVCLNENTPGRRRYGTATAPAGESDGFEPPAVPSAPPGSAFRLLFGNKISRRPVPLIE